MQYMVIRKKISNCTTYLTNLLLKPLILLQFLLTYLHTNFQQEKCNTFTYFQSLERARPPEIRCSGTCYRNVCCSHLELKLPIVDFLSCQIVTGVYPFNLQQHNTDFEITYMGTNYRVSYLMASANP